MKYLLKLIINLDQIKYTYFDLNNLEDSALRSVIAQSIANARVHNIEYTLEVKILFHHYQWNY